MHARALNRSFTFVVLFSAICTILRRVCVCFYVYMSVCVYVCTSRQPCRKWLSCMMQALCSQTVHSLRKHASQPFHHVGQHMHGALQQLLCRHVYTVPRYCARHTYIQLGSYHLGPLTHHIWVQLGRVYLMSMLSILNSVHCECTTPEQVCFISDTIA